MYSNLVTKIIKYETIKLKNKKIEKNKYKLIPDTKINVSQIDKISKVWPRSGWEINKSETGMIIMILKKYFTYKFFFSKDKIDDRKIIKKGFNISIGWNLGKKASSIHLFEPFTSIPMKGTKIKANRLIKKKKIENLTSKSWFKKEIINKVVIAKAMKTECLKKK